MRRPLCPPLTLRLTPHCWASCRISDDEAAATFEAALSAGVRYFDVAPAYGVGLAEMRLGRALRRAADEAGAAVRVPRSEVFVSTKVASRLVPDRAVGPNDGANSSGHGWAGGLSGFRREYSSERSHPTPDCQQGLADPPRGWAVTYDGFMAQHNESLQRMGQAYVDGLLIHGPGECEGESWDQLTKGGVREGLSSRPDLALSCVWYAAPS